MMNIVISSLVGAVVSALVISIKDWYFNKNKIEDENKRLAICLRNGLERFIVIMGKYVNTMTINYIDNYDAMSIVGKLICNPEHRGQANLYLDESLFNINMADNLCLNKVFELQFMIQASQLELSDYIDMLSITEIIEEDSELQIKCKCKEINLRSHIGLHALEVIEYIESRYNLKPLEVKIRGTFIKEIFQAGIDKTENKYKFSIENKFDCID